jgi:hypothetical protein
MILAFIAMMFAFACEKDSVVSSEMQSIEFRENIPSAPTSDGGIMPYIIPSENEGGNRTCGEVATAFEVESGFEFTSDKIDYDDSNGSFSGDWPAGLTVNTDGTYVTWSFDAEVFKGATGWCLSEMAVIVKGSDDANVYYYNLTDNPQSTYSDSGLASPLNASGNPAGLSNLTFCFNLVECGTPPEECYQDETAWAANGYEFGSLRYVTRGNWATYVEYLGTEKEVYLYAGQNMLAGTATFSAPDDGMIDITISLANDFIFFQEDVDDPDNNLKVQDYEFAPSGNPAPGLFAWKATLPLGAITAVITVPSNNFYGVHLDVAYPVPCPEPE